MFMHLYINLIMHSKIKSKNASLPLLHEQEMHSPVSNDNEDTGKYCQSNHIVPQGKVVETKGTENAGSRYFDVKTVSMIFKS